MARTVTLDVNVTLDYPKETEVIVSPQYTLRFTASDETQAVEVSIDGGPWQECRQASGFFWFDWEKYMSGRHEVKTRARLANGQTHKTDTRRVQVELNQEVSSMKRKDRMISAALAAALAAVLSAGPALAQDPQSQMQTPARAASVALVQQKDANTTVDSWPAETKKAAQALIEKYGQPDGVMDHALIWKNKEQWQQVTVYRDAVTHSLPMPHQDFIENTISYKVPESKVSDLIKFDLALVIDGTRGTLASHCDTEKANTLALNLANEIVTGKRTVASAKAFLRDTMMKTMAGKDSPYTEKLMFMPSSRGY